MRISDWSSDVCSSDLRDVGEADGTAIADRQPRFAELVGVFRIPEHAHRLLAARDFGAPARGVDIHLPQLLVHLAVGQAIALHPRGIEDHADFAIDAARAADLRHPRNRPQFLANIIYRKSAVK